MNLRILLIDDDEGVREKYKELLEGDHVEDMEIKKVKSSDFEQGKELLKKEHFDIVVLDLCKGDPKPESEKTGEEILDIIKNAAFVPVVFFTGLPGHVEGLVSDIIRVCSKGDALDGLKREIGYILQTDYLKMKNKVVEITDDSIRSFFWDFVHPNKELISNVKDDVSLTYLLLRRLAKSLSKEQIRKFIEDDKLKEELAHGMEFYIYPPIPGEFETGDILIDKETKVPYAILTPSCDLVEQPKKGRRAENILLIMGQSFYELDDYKKYEDLLYKDNKEEKKQLKNVEDKLKNWMRNNQGSKDRYFFLPETPFLKASILDFQQKRLVTYDELESNFDYLTKLDDPFAQSMLSTFTRYYNRIGYPDLDVDYAFNQIFHE